MLQEVLQQEKSLEDEKLSDQLSGVGDNNSEQASKVLYLQVRVKLTKTAKWIQCSLNIWSNWRGKKTQ